MRRPSSSGERSPIPFDPSRFTWDLAALATLEHCTIADGPVSGEVPGRCGKLGARDALSLLGQFAAHLAFLRFSGLPPGELDAEEWRIIRRRGSDCRLVRVAAASSQDEEPLAMTLLDQFARIVSAPALSFFSSSWGKPEALYAEIDRQLRDAPAAGSEWFRRAATGAVHAPGAEALRALVSMQPVILACDGDGEIESVERFARLGALGGRRLLVLGENASPLVARSAFSHEGPPTASEGELAETLLDEFRSCEAVLVVRSTASFDAASRRILRLLLDSDEALAWVLPRSELGMRIAAPGNETRHFLLSTRLADWRRVETQLRGMTSTQARESLQRLVALPAYRDYLDGAEVSLPGPEQRIESLMEPARSWLAALALLGDDIAEEEAILLLRELGHAGELGVVLVEGVTELTEGRLRFVSPAVRRRLREILSASTAAGIATLAAGKVARGDVIARARLLAGAGALDAAAAALQGTAWREVADSRLIESLSQLPPSLFALAPEAGYALAGALLRAGRYLDAGSLAGQLPPDLAGLLLAQIEKRSGSYHAALAHLSAVPEAMRRFHVVLLEGEIHRLLGDFVSAAECLTRCEPLAQREEQVARLRYERAMLAFDSGMTPPPEEAQDEAAPYHRARYRVRAAESDGSWTRAVEQAREACRFAADVPQRIDASLDLVHALLFAGQWEEARREGRAALTLIEETQGDRSAAAVLFALAYLCADAGLWQQASQKIDRLVQFYTLLGDSTRLEELDLARAHYALCRGDSGGARRLATRAVSLPLHPEYEQAAQTIIAECDWLDGSEIDVSSLGRTRSLEMRDRQRLLHQRAGVDGSPDPEQPFLREIALFERRTRKGEPSTPPAPANRTEQLLLLRSLVGSARRRPDSVLQPAIDTLVRELSLAPMLRQSGNAAAVEELDLIRMLSSCEMPLRSDSLGDQWRWRYASRNRLGRWIENGTVSTTTPEELEKRLVGTSADVVPVGTSAFFELEGLGRFEERTRRALALLLEERTELANRRRIEEAERSSGAEPVRAEGIVGDSPAVRELVRTISGIAPTEAPVCIEGESGTGKELIARAIHSGSKRRSRRFVAVNCAALPENLIESELFGCVRGAFTGADRDRSGLIEAADGGTLFLDEIGEMPLLAQAKLLRFLQEREYRRVGDTSTRTADVRIVSATNRRLETAIDEGKFREDLYYRIRVVELHVPPLRERGGDILVLAHAFLRQAQRADGGGPKRFSEDVEAIFLAHSWPGNVRELQNAVSGAVALAGEARTIEVEHLARSLRGLPKLRIRRGSFNEEVARFRRDLIDRALAESGGNQSAAARRLGLSRQALAYQIRELGILVR